MDSGGRTAANRPCLEGELRAGSQATGLVVRHLRGSRHEPPLRDSAGFSPASLNTLHPAAGATRRCNHSAGIAYARTLHERHDR